MPIVDMISGYFKEYSFKACLQKTCRTDFQRLYTLLGLGGFQHMAFSLQEHTPAKCQVFVSNHRYTGTLPSLIRTRC